MAGLRIRLAHGALACLSLFALLFAGEALAQSYPAAPATLRLAQVVVRLPKIYLYASEQDESGKPFTREWGTPSTLIGPTYTKAEINPEPEGIAIVFLIDISKSLSKPQFELIRASVRAWIESLGPSDQAAIVTLGSNVKTVENFTGDKVKLNNALPLAPSDMQTLLYQGLVQAIDLSRRRDPDLPRRRAIVTLTDGMDDQKGGAGRQEVLDKLAIDPTPIYALGASAQNNARVDAALKDFAGLVRASGGEYRPGDIKSPDKGYNELRSIIRSTKHLVAECNDPPCAPDGSPIVVRLFMSQDPVRLSSESVTVRLVNKYGEVSRQTPTPPTPPPPHKPWWKELLDFLAELRPIWKAVLALLAAGSIAGATIPFSFPDLPKRVVIFLWGRRPLPNPEPLKTTKQEVGDSVVVIKPSVLVPYDTRQDRQRLRLYPLGHNEIGPFDLLFENTLAVGRSPDSEICISNDAQVSANHCALSPQGKSILVEDSGSRNGTRVNGVPINGFLHAEPDSVLGVGRTELRMKLLPVGAR
jgi:hypothetical protein